MTIRCLYVIVLCLIPTLSFAGSFMAWAGDEYHMQEGDIVGPTQDGQDFSIRRLIIWRNGERDFESKCYVNYDGNAPTLVYCSRVKDSLLMGAIWLPKKQNDFECVAYCRLSVPKILKRFLVDTSE